MQHYAKMAAAIPRVDWTCKDAVSLSELRSIDLKKRGKRASRASERRAALRKEATK